MKKNAVGLILCSLAVGLACLLASSMASAAETACQHEWEFFETYYDDYSSTKHKKVDCYRCSICGADKEKVIYEEHKWNLIEDYYDYVSKDNHVFSEYFSCEKCNREKTVETKEPHEWELTGENGYEKSSKNYHVYYEGIRCVKCDYETYTETKQPHEWKDLESYYEYISKDKHMFIEGFECEKCDETKEEKTKQPHEWVLDESVDTEIVKRTKDSHTVSRHYYCKQCRDYSEQAEKDVKAKEPHTFDGYGKCTVCEYLNDATIRLKSGKKQKVNAKTWAKVVLKKNGYIDVSVDHSGTVTLYSESKKYIDEYYSEKKKFIIPVPKGTYMLKFGCDYDSQTDTVKYVFHKDPSSKNYTVKTAKKINSNKIVEAVIYSKAKEKTWTRYYKIHLSKKQFIRIYDVASDATWHMVMYDKKMNRLSEDFLKDSKGDYVGIISSYKQPAGDYYFKLAKEWTQAEKRLNPSSYFSFKWK